MAVSDRFVTLLDKIAPSDSELSTYTRHLKTVAGSVSSTLETNRVQAIGSYARGTAIRHYSDLDLLVILSRSAVKWGDRNKSSDTTLLRVRSALEGRFPGTPIKRDANVVVTHFRGGARPVDVVPAFYLGPIPEFRNYPLFAIADGMGGWIHTSPEAHNRYLSDENDRSRGKLKRAAQLLKYWAAVNANVRLSSFHIELLLASSKIAATPISYGNLLHDFFRLLDQRKAAALRDPLAISGYIAACKTEAMRQRLQTSVRKAAYHSGRALEAETARNTPEAVRQWSIVFNHQAFAR